MEKITATIITKNEAGNIRRCLESLEWAEEIIVGDSASTDETVQICRDFGCQVFTPEWGGFGRTKQLCVERARNDWIFSIDADEVVSDRLKKAILAFKPEPGVAGFTIKRKSFYLGRQIRYSGWQDDAPLRLFNKNSCRFSEDIVHEKVLTTAGTESLNGFLFHYTYPDISTHLVKMIRYASLGAEKMWAEGVKSGFFKPVYHSCFRFIKTYLFRFGFLDGREGFLLAAVQSFEVFLKYQKLWEFHKKNGKIKRK